MSEYLSLRNPHANIRERSRMLPFIIGLLLFVSTTNHLNNLLLLGVPLCVWLEKGRPQLHLEAINVFEYILIAFAVLACIDISIGIIFTSKYSLSSYAVILIPVFAITARHISREDWVFFIFLTCIEIIVSLIEYYLGIHSFFTIPDVDKAFIDDSLYQSRVFGLSLNSSSVAGKVFLCILLLPFVSNNLGKIKVRAIGTLLFLGIIVTFNRTAIISSVIFIILYYAYHHGNRISLYLFILTISVASLYLFNVDEVFDEITMQFTRGGGDLMENESLRQIYWEQAINFIMSNPFFGNSSLKYGVISPDFIELVHAHNSFLMLFATHGLVLSIIFFTFMFFRLEPEAYIYLIPIFAYSMTQYMIFWNASVSDIMLFWILSRFRRIH